MSSNVAEAAFGEWAQAKGWHATKKGYPDFICLTEHGELSLVEVKPHRSTPLDPAQIKAIRLLLGYGVPCFRWSPDDSALQRMTPVSVAADVSEVATAASLGQRGGQSRAAHLTPEQRSEAARSAAKARWDKREKPRD